MPEFTRPTLYPKQLEAMFTKRRWGFIEAGTKSGKTVSAMAWLIELALTGNSGWNYWWVAPGYNQSDIAFRRVKAGLTKGAFTSFESPTPRIILMNGATIWFKTGDNPDALYGEDVYGAVVDEASRVLEECWFALRSTLTATRGPMRAIGNVKGKKNWFFNLARQAERGDLPDSYYASITASDAVAAGILAEEEIADAKRMLPEHVFQELYYNVPSDDGGNPFGIEHIRACTEPVAAEGPAVAWGLDLAKSRDYFVCIGLNEAGSVCAFERWRSPWRISIRRAWSIIGEDAPALVDSTGVGDPVLEELQVDHGNFIGFHLSMASKQRLMEGLAVSIQSHEITFPDGLIRQELEDFEYEYTKSGVRYAGADGKHDDCVVALALARQMWAEGAPGANLIQYMKKARAEAKPESELADNNRPWRATAPVPAANLDNELTQLYEATLAAGASSGNRCHYCGEAVLGDRVSDGVYTWHPLCSRRTRVA